MPPPIHGILNLDKPAGLSSAAVVGKIKWMLPRGVKVGHAGTLDPFATGVLLILIGKATRQCESLMDEPKSYHATVTLGATTATDDCTEPERPSELAGGPPTRANIESLLAEFVGEVIQQPPAFSAIKIGGKRAYQLARRGLAPQLKPRAVRVHALSIENYQWPLLTIDVKCGRGFYVRALARDLGRRTGVGGYLTALRRTAVGPYTVQAATDLETLSTASIEAILC